MNDIHKKAIVYIAVYIMIFSSFIIAAQGTAVSITISGNNASVANTNKTCYGCNNSINVVAWNTSYTKTWMVNSRNNSLDILTFNISNVSAWQVQQLTVNGSIVSAYQAGANGMLNFSYTTNESNKTYTLSPAANTNGWNMTWAKIWNGAGFTRQSQHDSLSCDTVYKNNNGNGTSFISFGHSATAGNAIIVKSDSMNPPIAVVYRGLSPSSTLGYRIQFFVLPGYYWTMTGTACGTNSNSTIWR